MTVGAETVAHCDDSTEGDRANFPTFTELFSGWTGKRAEWSKSANAVLAQLQELERVVRPQGVVLGIGGAALRSGMLPGSTQYPPGRKPVLRGQYA